VERGRNVLVERVVSEFDLSFRINLRQRRQLASLASFRSPGMPRMELFAEFVSRGVK
jgi:hypothetical protein